MSALPSVGHADAALAADSTRVLYEAYSRRIFAYCLSRLGSREEAEDATQTTFLNAFRSIQGGVVPRFELAWLFRIAENVCRDGHKSASRRMRVETTRDLHEVQDVVSAPARNDDGLVGLGDALAGMPERQRQAILLREWRGLSYGEIAGELGLSKSAVETLIFRARRTLARGLEAPVQRRAGFDVLSLFGAAKSALQGGAAAKLAAAAIAAGGAAAVVGLPLADRARPAPQHDGTPAETPAPQPAAPVGEGAPPAAAEAPSSRRPQRPAPARVRSGAGEQASVQARGHAPATSRPAAPRASELAPPRRQPPRPSVPASTDGAATPTTPPAPDPPAPVAPPPPAGLPDVPGLPGVPPVVPPLPPLEPPTLPPHPEAPALDPPGLPPLP